MADRKLNVSMTVHRAREELENRGPIPAWTLAEAILELHPEYGNDTANELLAWSRNRGSHGGVGSEASEKSGSAFTPATSEAEIPFESEATPGEGDSPPTARPTRPVSEWLFAVQDQFHETTPPPRLDGRLVLLGLALIDRTVREALQHDDFVLALLEETTDFEAAVSVPDWRERLGDTRSAPREQTPLLTDRPIDDPDSDLLNRQAFAAYLADLIDELSTGDGSRGAYSVHLSGDWGVGKTSILHFLQEELESNHSNRRDGSDTDRGKPGDGAGTTWKVIQFNAWQHQHINPPWWALLDHVYQDCRSSMHPVDRAREWVWRWSRKRVQALAAVVIMALLGGGLVAVLLQGVDTGPLSPELIGGLAALLAVLWTVSVAMSKPLALRSSQAAESYIRYASNPMSTIEDRFEGLIERIDADRVAIFIDDVDRCSSEYVVGLLEGIQTLFQGAPVVFVVAGDRDWIDTSFEDVYGAQASAHDAVGKSLGTLFLEKTFQLSTPVPRMNQQLQTTFVKALTEHRVESDVAETASSSVGHGTGPGGDGQTGTAESVSEEAQRCLDAIEAATDETEILDVLERTAALPMEEQRLVRAAAVRTFGTLEVREQTEYVLLDYVELLEPNPRGIKRLMNTYGVNRVLATLAHTDVSHEQLALWTVLSMRWPDLADDLAHSPELLADGAGEQAAGTTDAESDTNRLLDHPDVAAVINWEADPLTPDTVRQCARIWG